MTTKPLKPRPPREAIDAFRAKGFQLAPSFSWKDRFEEDHAAAFTAAKALSADVLQTLHGAVEKALVEGKTFRSFAEELEPKLAAAGWWGQKEQTDPLTGERKLVQLGSPRRLRLIFDVNVRQAHASGQWARIQRNKRSRPYLMYSALLDERTRPEHRAWHGIVRPVDDRFWDTHTPMNGWRCRCTLRQLSQRDLDRRGLRVSQAPNMRTRRWRNDRTGQTSEVPEGIDPGFAYNPGRAAIDRNAARVFADKSATWAPPISAAATAASGRVLLNAQGAEFRDWLDDLGQRRRRPSGDLRVVGVLDGDTLRGLQARGISPRSGAITIKDDAVAHLSRDAKRSAIGRDQLRGLPEILAKPKAVLRDTRDGDLLYVVDGPDRATKVVVRLDMAQKGRAPGGRRGRFATNSVVTASKIPTANLREPHYDVVSGDL